MLETKTFNKKKSRLNKNQLKRKQKPSPKRNKRIIKSPSPKSLVRKRRKTPSKKNREKKW